MNYLLGVIDVFSKFLWVRPMKNKNARSLVQAFDSILSEKIKPEKLRTDKGTEFINEPFQQYLNPINPGLLALELTLGGGVFHPPAIKQEPLKLEG